MDKDLTVYRKKRKVKRKQIRTHYNPKQSSYNVSDLAPETHRRYLEQRYIGWRKRYNDPKWVKQNRMTSLRSLYRKLGRYKTCTDCERTKLLCEFDRLKSKHVSYNVRRSYCKECRSLMNKKAYKRRKNELR